MISFKFSCWEILSEDLLGGIWNNSHLIRLGDMYPHMELKPFGQLFAMVLMVFNNNQQTWNY
jgi:hypothetical protein